MDLAAAFRTFVRVAETESFSVTARELNLGQPAISKQVSSLEDYLGMRLFQRTTRKLALTDEGRQLVPLARMAVEAVDEAIDSMRRKEGRVTGTLRFTTSVSFGRMHIVPRLPMFFAQHPDVSIDLVLQDTTADLIDSGIDLAIRFGEPREQNVIARRIGNVGFVTVASRNYLDRAGRPETPADLARHQCILFSGSPVGHLWQFSRGEEKLKVEVSGRLSIDNSDAIRFAAIHDLGVVNAPAWLFSDIWDLDGMETLFDDWSKGEIPVFAVYPSRRFVPGKVRAMIEFMEYEMRLDPTMTGQPMVV